MSLRCKLKYTTKSICYKNEIDSFTNNNEKNALSIIEQAFNAPQLFIYYSRNKIQDDVNEGRVLVNEIIMYINYISYKIWQQFEISIY